MQCRLPFMQGRLFFCVLTTCWTAQKQLSLASLYGSPAQDQQNLKKLGPGLGHSEITKSGTGPLAGGRDHGQLVKTGMWLSQPDPDWGKVLAILVSDNRVLNRLDYVLCNLLYNITPMSHAIYNQLGRQHTMYFQNISI